MRLHVLGSSGTYPAPGRPASGYLVEQGDTRVWCDAGPGTFTALWDLMDFAMLSAVVVSHRHLDHCLDVLSAHHAITYGPRTLPQVPLIAPRSVIDHLDAFLGDTDSLASSFVLDPVDDGDTRTIGGISVGFARSDHSVPTLASRWEAGDRVLAYTGDTGPVGEWSRVAEGANLFLCEASYQGESGVNPYPHHLTAAEAGAIARRQGAQRLLLTHIPVYLDTALSLMEAETTYGRPVGVAAPGTVHDV